MRYTFGAYLLDTACYELYHAGTRVPLRPKALEVLAYLVMHHDRVVSKQELLAQLWPDQVVGEDGLKAYILAVRQALGERGTAPRLLQTVRGRGYRFLATATVETCPAPRASLAPETTPASTVQGVPIGERKLVTLLGCTLNQATVRRGRVGLDALHSQMRILYTLAQEEVHRYGGIIHHVAGTRLLAIFGAPVAHEDHARRALLAAWGLHQRLAVSQSGDPAAEPLAVCLGLHTGLMVLGGIGDAQEPDAVVGDLPLTVEALQERAESGMLLCSAATARLVRRAVRLEEVAPVPVPGQPLPVRIYQVVGLRTPDGAGAQVERWGRSPFVGRTHELATLHAVLAQVVDGRGQVVGMVGEPGMGKSRLLAEWRQRRHTHGVTYLEGRCLSYGSATPYLPVLDWLRAHCGITPADGDEAVTAKVCGSLRAVGLAPDTAAPYLLHLLGVEAATVQVAGSSPETLKAHTFATLRQLWLKSSQQHPLILAVEDLHWSDPTSEEFVASLVEGLPGAALLVLGTYRPGYRPAWLEKSYATQLTVPPLSAQDSVQVVQAVLQRETVPPPLAEALLAKAQGNPFFLEELAQTLVEQDVEQGAPTIRSLRPWSSLIDLQLPLTVQAVLAARIDRLAPEAKRLLQTAAVMGTDVPVPLLQAIAELPEAVLHQSLAHLQAAEFLYETHRFPEHAYTFKHALTHEVAYHSLLLERRRGLHARLVETLEALTSVLGAQAASGAQGLPAGRQDPDQVERLAHHAVRGEVWEKAVTYCQQAGEKALARSAYHEAVTAFEQALGALQHLPESRAVCERAIDLRLTLDFPLWRLGDWGRVVASLREAEALAERLDDQRRLAQVSSEMADGCRILSDYERALRAGQRALTLATALGDSALQVEATTTLGLIYCHRGAYGQAIEALRQAVGSLASQGSQAHRDRPEFPELWPRSWLLVCCAEVGAFAEGRAMSADILRLAEATERPFDLAVTIFGVGRLSLRQGDLSQAMAVLEQGLAVCHAHDLRDWIPTLAADMGYAYALAGRLPEALTLLDQAVGQSEIMRGGALAAKYVIWLGEAYLLAGRLDETYTQAQRALEFSRAHQERGSEAYALQLLGEVAAQRQPPQGEWAAAHYRQALTLTHELGMRPLQAHCHRGLGVLYARSGQREQAHAALTTAIALYRDMEMIFWLPQVEAALAQVET